MQWSSNNVPSVQGLPGQVSGRVRGARKGAERVLRVHADEKQKCHQYEETEEATKKKGPA